MPPLWNCPQCGRVFRQKNQAHSCGTGNRRELLAGKNPNLGRLYESLESQVRKWKGTEIVVRGRYALLRTTRIFADVVFMTDCLRIAVLLDRRVRDPLFFKVDELSTKRVGHVAKVRSAAELKAAMVFVKEAYRFAMGE